MTAPAEVYTLDDLRRWPDVTAAAYPPLRLAVCGDPVIHSASPPMHNAALVACGIAAGYTRLHLKAEELAPAFRLLADAGFIGVNCTIPHKAEALRLVDEADDHARRIGVVNTVRVEQGKLRGFNTDGPGLVRAVQEQLGVSLGDLRVLVLGAGGGAGRAIAMQCAFEGCPRLSLVNRTAEKVRELAAELSTGAMVTSVVPWEDAALQTALAEMDLVINCTAVGMKAGESSPLPSELLNSRLMIYDTIYTSARTPLMLAADAVGARAANGLSMLLHQGALAFEIWFEREAPVEVMRNALLAHAPR